MFIPSNTNQILNTDTTLCGIQRSLALNKRDITDTAKSFKSWDSCQQNTVCKIVSIVGLVILGLIALWVVIGVIRCCCSGISTLAACCFCCCSDRHRSMEPPQFVGNQHHHQPLYNPPPSYQQQPPPPPVVPSGPARDLSPSPHPVGPPVQNSRYNQDYDYGYVGNYGDTRPHSAYYPPDNGYGRESMEMGNFSHQHNPYDTKDPFDPSRGRHAYF